MPPLFLDHASAYNECPDFLSDSSCSTFSPPLHQGGADDSPRFDPLGILWNTKLPIDLRHRVLACLPYEDLFRFKCVSKQVKGFLESNPFQGLGLELSTPKVTLTTPYFYIANDGILQCAGFDTSVNMWRRLPPLTYLPRPDPELFKEYQVCAEGGLVCFNISERVRKDSLIVFNPLTGESKALPPLNRRRNPVLMHMIVDKVTQSYQVVVAGSSAMAGDEQQNFSKVTEVYDSCTSEWRRTGDLPGPEYALNEFQTGVYQDGNILCIALLEPEQKGIVVYDVAQGRWLEYRTTRLPSSVSSCPILQLVECCGKVYLFSEQEIGNGWIEHSVDMMEWTHSKSDEPVPCAMRTVIRNRQTRGNLGLEVYPEFTCVPYGESQLCIFNVISHSGVVFDVQQDGHSHQPQVLQPPPQAWHGASFHSLNPLSFPVDLTVASQAK